MSRRVCRRLLLSMTMGQTTGQLYEGLIKPLVVPSFRRLLVTPLVGKPTGKLVDDMPGNQICITV